MKFVRRHHRRGARLGDELHRLVAADVEDVVARRDPEQDIADFLVIVIARKLRRVLEANEDDIDLVRFEPVHGRTDGLLELLGRNARQRVVCAKLPQHEIGTLDRHFTAQTFGGRRSDLAGNPAIDDIDFDAVQRLSQNVVELRRIIARAGRGADARGRGGSDRQDTQLLSAGQQGRQIRQGRGRRNVGRRRLTLRAQRRRVLGAQSRRRKESEAQARCGESAGDLARHSEIHALNPMMTRPTNNMDVSTTIPPP